jgi:hypothetical protein
MVRPRRTVGRLRTTRPLMGRRWWPRHSRGGCRCPIALALPSELPHPIGGVRKQSPDRAPAHDSMSGRPSVATRGGGTSVNAVRDSGQRRMGSTAVPIASKH